MPTISRGFVNQSELADEVAQVAKTLERRDVRDVRFTIGNDFTGDPAVFFRVLLTRHGSQESRLGAVTGAITNALFDKIQPYNRWGLQGYVNFSNNKANYSNDECG